MIYITPPLSDLDETVLGMIDELRAELRFYLHEPRRWSESLRRAAFAAAAQGSLSIEGYRASVESTAAVIDGEEPPEVDAATRQAIGGYRDALTCVQQMATVSPEINARLLQSLHFMMMRHDFTKNPGQWRPGSVWISDSSGNVVYEAPARDLLEPLVEEMLTQVTDSDAPPPVTAAMAHLNLTLIHPFSDGNGRMARCVQTFILVGGGLGSPAFVSIEEYLGANTAAYYDVLTGVGGGKWSPQRSARPWIEFCLTAHWRQALALRQRIRETEALWDRCEQLVGRHGLANRGVGGLADAARGWTLRRSLYVKITRLTTGDEISDNTATNDLAAMVSAGLLAPLGQRRTRTYEATDELRSVWQGIRGQRPPLAAIDPYEHARRSIRARPSPPVA